MYDGKYLPVIRKHVLLMSSVFGRKYSCEQLFSLMKADKSRTRTRLTDEHLEGCMRIGTTEIKPHFHRLVMQNQCQISH
jgi:hypothetical protein